MKKWLIDTDIIIDYFRGFEESVSFLERIIEQDSCFLSVITIAELYAGIKEGKERHFLESFLKSFDILQLDSTIAQLGGLYRRDYGRSHGVGLADAILAATSDFYHVRLATLNAKHFPMLKNVCIPYAKP